LKFRTVSIALLTEATANGNLRMRFEAGPVPAFHHKRVAGLPAVPRKFQRL